MVKTIIWTYQAETELYNAFINLLEQSKSIETTTKIISEIYQSTNILSFTPEIYKLDTLKKNNTGNVRTYQKHRYRISYLIEEKAIYIIRIRHASKEPLQY